MAHGGEDSPVIGLGDFGEQVDDDFKGVKFAATMALAPGELAKGLFGCTWLT
jgi:hypothetical protein